MLSCMHGDQQAGRYLSQKSCSAFVESFHFMLKVLTANIIHKSVIDKLNPSSKILSVKLKERNTHIPPC